MGLLEHRLDVFDGLAPLHPRMPQHARAELGPEGMRGNGPGTGAEQVREVGGGGRPDRAWGVGDEGTAACPSCQTQRPRGGKLQDRGNKFECKRIGLISSV